MSDERFDRDLADVLRELAGEDAPMSLRFRLSDMTERGPVGQRLWFATPMRLSMVAAAAAVAVLALAIIFLPREAVGPAPSESPSVEPTPTVEPTSALSMEPAATLTVEPTTEPTPMTTPGPTPTGEWTGLVWSDPVTPSFTVHLYDLVPWGDGYVAVGEVPLGDARAEAVFLTSPDGVTWRVRHRTDPGFDRYPRYLETMGDELIAFSPGDTDHGVTGMVLAAPPLIWSSSDGATWTLVDSPSWRASWQDAWLLGVESGPDGIVAIGNHLAGEYNQLYGDPIVLRSTDGVEWDRMTIEGLSPQSVVTDVVGFRGGFALLGGTETGIVTGVGMPQAWFSDDGMTWKPASVEGATEGDNQFEWQAGQAGASGLVSRSPVMCAGCIERPVAWRSIDGRSWQRDVTLGVEIRAGLMASDGTRIVSLGSWRGPAGFPPPSAPAPAVTTAWVSTDGIVWTELRLSDALTDQPERFWVVPDGVIYAGYQSFWFGTAVEE